MAQGSTMLCGCAWPGRTWTRPVKPSVALYWAATSAGRVSRSFSRLTLACPFDTPGPSKFERPHLSIACDHTGHICLPPQQNQQGQQNCSRAFACLGAGRIPAILRLLHAPHLLQQVCCPRENICPASHLLGGCIQPLPPGFKDVCRCVLADRKEVTLVVCMNSCLCACQPAAPQSKQQVHATSRSMSGRRAPA